MTESYPGQGLVRGADRPVPTLALRPMTVADILDGAFAVVKARPARLLGITAGLVVPLYLAVAYLQRDALGGLGVWEVLNDEDLDTTRDAVEGSQAGPLETGLQWLGPTVVLVAVAAVIAYMLGSWTAGRDPGVGELLTVLTRRSWALAASFVLVHLVEGVAGLLTCAVGVPFVMPFFVATAPAIGAEGAGPLAAMGRAARLATRRYWPTLGISLLIGLVGYFLAVALGLLPQAVALMIGYDAAWPLLALGGIAGAVVATPFTAGATVLLYLDLRVRTEGLDLELDARTAFSGTPPA